MPLPNTNSYGKFQQEPTDVTPRYSPNKTAGMQQADVDTAEQTKLASQTQKLAEMFGKLEAKLTNVFSPRNAVQSGLYSAFGSNVLTRGLSELSDTMFDSISGLFAGKEKEKEDDPVVKNIKVTNKKLEKLTENLIDITKRGSKQNLTTDPLFVDFVRHSKQSATANQILLGDILDALTGTGHPARGVPPEKSFSTTVTPDEIIDVAKVPRLPYHPAKETAVKDVSYRDIPLQKPSPTVSDIPDLGIGVTPPSMPEPDQNIPKANKPDTDKEELIVHKKSESTLTKILGMLVEIHKGITTIGKDTQVSTQETTLESEIKKQAGITPVSTAGKAPILTEKVAAAVSPTVSKPAGGETSVLEDVAGLANIASNIPFPTGGKAPVPTPGPGTVSKAGKLLKMGKTALRFAAGGGLMALGGMGVDWAAGQLGVGQSPIDTKQDDSNWERMSTGQRFLSGTARGIEHVGSFLGLENITNEAKSARIRAETKLLTPSTVTSPAASAELIPETKPPLGKPLDQTIPSATKSPEESLRRINQAAVSPTQATTVAPNNNIQVNANSVNNTVIPTRAVVKNPDPSLNNYLNRLLSY